MARPLRAQSETLTPAKRRERRSHPGNLPPVQEGPSHHVNREDDDSEEQDDEDHISDADQRSDEVEGRYVINADLPADVSREDQPDNEDISQGADSDEEINEDLMKANNRLIRASGDFDKITQQLLQENPTTSQTRVFWEGVPSRPNHESEELSSSDAEDEEAEESAARLNAVTRFRLRSGQDSGSHAHPNPKIGKRTTTATRGSSEDLPLRSVEVRRILTAHSPVARPAEDTTRQPSRALRAARRGAPPVISNKMPTGAAVTPQNPSLSLGKRKRTMEARPSSGSLQRHDVPRGSQAAKILASTASANRASGSRSKGLARPPRTYNDMSNVMSSEIQRAPPRPRTDLYTPQLSPEEERTAAKQLSRSTRASSANAKKLRAMSSRSPTEVRSRPVTRATRNQRNSKPEQPEQQAESDEDEVLGGEEGEEDDMEAVESIQKLQRVSSKGQVKPTSTVSSAVSPVGRRTTRSNPTGDRTLAQNTTSGPIVRRAPSASKAKNTEQAAARRASLRGPVVKVVSEGPRGAIRTEIRVTRGTHNVAGSSRHRSTVTEVEEQQRTTQQARRKHLNEGLSNTLDQSSDAQGSEASYATQLEEQISDSSVEEDGDDQLSNVQRLGRIVGFLNDIRRKRMEPAFRCKTRAIGEFLYDIKEMRSLYVKLAELEQDTNLYDRLCEKLDKKLKEIEDSDYYIMQLMTQNVPEKDRGGNILREKRTTLQDLYIWAIPDIVSTIRTAAEAYGDGYIPTPEVRRIMRLQAVVIRLGNRAWSRGVRMHKGLDEYLIKHNEVLLHIKRLQKAYSGELRERRTERSRRFEANRQRRILEEQRMREEREREIKRRRKIIHQQIIAELERTDPKNSGIRYGGGWGVGSSGSSTQDGYVGNKPNEWPEAELLALVEGLEKFTGKDRYAQIVREHCEPGGVLQSRSMDEVFEKAKEFKADVYGDWELHPDDGPLPDYILSI